ncbi:MAG TPA: NHL repeat-containing protein [Solirubrobacterales bacterium]|jgi:sugar lactone lactonase YvrE
MIRRLTVAALCAAALFLLVPMAAFAAHSLRYTIGPFEPTPEHPEHLEGPCGAAVDSQGNVFVSDYYSDKIVVFNSSGGYLSEVFGINPLDGPCGLAIDADGVIYANLYHAGIAVLEPSGATYTNRGEVISANATGVAIDPVTGNLLVDERVGIAEYELPLTVGPQPLRTIGSGSLGDGYGVAVSGFEGTEGWIYAADAATGSVKVYDPATSLTAPAAELDGTGTALGHFNDLSDAALALDESNGHLFVADDLSGRLFESALAGVQEFGPDGTFEGQLEPKSVDGDPVGLAVDNTGGATQGDVYVTSGNTENAQVFAFGPTVTAFRSLAPPGGAATGGGNSPSTPADEAEPSPSSEGEPAATASTITQKGTLRVQAKGGMNPTKLPRTGTAPVSVSVSGHVTTVDGSAPPRLRILTIDINRNGIFDLAGLPPCPVSKIQPASSARALAACEPSLVGQGRFWGESSLSGEPYETQGRLLLFYGRQGGKPMIFGQIYSSKPFTSSYVVPFSVRTLPHGTYGTELRANLAAALGNRASLTGIEMTLSRRYVSEGRHRSVISAGCPAPKGFPSAVFPLLRASFSFDGPSVSSVLAGNCRALGK